MNSKKLKVLYLDDIEDDAIIIREQLIEEGLIFQFDYVRTENEFTSKLKSEQYDIILSDFNLPGFNGIAALLLSKKICPDVPFICISGTIGEDIAVELMHLGASDYILKDKLNKLPVAVNRAILAAKEHHTRIEAEVSLRESEARFRDIIMSSYDWVWEIDRNWKYCYTSETIGNILGYTNEEVINKSRFDFMPDDEKEIFEPVFSEIAVRKGIIKDVENWNLHKDGHRVCLLTNGFPIFDDAGNLTGYRGVDKDITNNKNLNIELIKAKERAEASDKLKTAFLSNISHEVRTPLNGILGFSELVLQPDLQQEEKEYFLKVLNESSERLINTITNYMDISLIVSGNMIVNSIPVDLSLLLDNIYQKFLPKCQTKNLEFIKQFPSDTTPLLISDDGLLEKALSHLVDNAIKFTIKGSITFGWHYNNNEFELFVKDTGSGIDPEAQSSVFQIFMQEDVADTRGYEGSGLGLSIAKGLVELMGGKIRIESEKWQGSSFYITFPLAEGQRLEIKSPDKAELKKKTGESAVILIAEDDESNSTLLITILKQASLKYLLAFNGKEAVEFCMTHPEISVVLMDIKMPVMDGLEATRKIKELRKDLPIVGVTAYAMTGDKEKALEAGCDEYLTKPVKYDLLLSVINKFL
jgi:PAS domain S-box-containing protein